MMKTFITSDTHGFDERTLSFCDRPFPDVTVMNWEIIHRWNSVVSPEDKVIHLGDIVHFRTSAEKMQGFVSELNGQKILLRGNHDMYFKDEELLEVFEEVHAEPLVYLGPEGKEFWLCHYPVQRNLDYFTLCGHIHDKWKVARRMLNVGQDVHNFTPITLEKACKYEMAKAWDANVFPDASLDLRLEVTQAIERPEWDPTIGILRAELEAK